MKLQSFAVLAAISSVANAQLNITFEECDTADYYAGLPNDVADWTRELVHDLLFSTHRNVVEFTNNVDPGTDDVWGALIDVDAGEEPGTIRLIYSDEEIPKFPFGERGWYRDHLFPVSRGVANTGLDRADIHNLRAASPLSATVAADKYFGECGVLTKPDTCIEPAEGSAEGSCSCERVYTPPPDVKGDIARALMYMDLRYDGTELFTRNLRLTDCPFQPERDMAYLSQMLTWHREDPPDEREMIRNDKVCGNWQGNRNPFVDFPELADQLWGEPLPLPAVGERLIYEACEAIPTLAPTFTENNCDSYDEGDFVIWLMNSGEDPTLGFYSFAPMEAGFELYVTDNPYDGEKFLEQGLDVEGTIKFTAPANGLRGGTLFGYGDEDFPLVNLFETVEGNFTPSVEGEPLFIYCLAGGGDQRPLTVFNYGGILAEPGLENYAENETALPENFPEQGVINLPHFNNLIYTGQGVEELSTEDLRIAVRNPSNWEGSDDRRYTVDDRSGVAKLSSSTILVMVAVSSIFALM